MVDRPSSSIVRPLVAIAAFIVIVAGLRAFAPLLSPILLSLFIVLVTAPIVQWLKARRVPAWLANLIVILGVVFVGFLLILFLAGSVAQLSAALPEYRSLLERQAEALTAWMSSQGLQSADLLKLEFIQPAKLIQYALAFLSGLIGTLGNVGVTLFIYIYMLVGSSSFAQKLQRGLGADSAVLQRFQAFGRSVSLYLLIKGWLGAMTAIAQTVLLLVLGVDFAVLWGVLSFLFNFIPNVGYIIALVPPLVLGLLDSGVWTALLVFVGYAAINNFFDMVLGPRYLGKGLDLSTLITFLAVLFWTWILGPIGAFLALPLTVMFKTLVLEAYADSQLLAKLIGSDDVDNA